MRALMIVLAAGATLASGALAQDALAQDLPKRTRADRQLDEIGRAQRQQQQIVRESQQTQFEINQLRNQIQRNTISPIGGGSIGCPAGSIGC